MAFVPLQAAVNGGGGVALDIPATYFGWNQYSNADRGALIAGMFNGKMLVAAGAFRCVAVCAGCFDFTTLGDQTDAVPLWQLERLLARLGHPDANARTEMRIGEAALSPACLLRIEGVLIAQQLLTHVQLTPAKLAQKLDQCADELSVESHPELRITIDDFVVLEKLADGVALARSWSSMITLEQLTRNGRLGPFADLVGLVGPRALAATRTAQAGRYNVVMQSAKLAAAPEWAQAMDVLSGGHVATLLQTKWPAQLVIFPVTLQHAIEDISARRAMVTGAKDDVARAVRTRLADALPAFPAVHGYMRGCTSSLEMSNALESLAESAGCGGDLKLDTLQRVEAYLNRVGYVADATLPPAARVEALANTRRDIRNAQAPRSSTTRTTKLSYFQDQNKEALEVFLAQSLVTGPIVYRRRRDPATGLMAECQDAGVDELESGLLALIDYHKDNYIEILGVSYNTQAQAVHSFLDSELMHPAQLFRELALARDYIVAYFSDIITNEKGGKKLNPADKSWRIEKDDPEALKLLRSGDWDKINFFNCCFVSIESHRSAVLAPAKLSGKSALHDQWTHLHTPRVIAYAAKMFTGLGFLFDGVGSFKEKANEVQDYRLSATAAIDKSAHDKNASIVMVDLLRHAGRRYATFVNGPPGSQFPDFSLDTDPAAQDLDRHKDARGLLTELASHYPSLVTGRAPATASGDADATSDGERKPKKPRTGKTKKEQPGKPPAKPDKPQPQPGQFAADVKDDGQTSGEVTIFFKGRPGKPGAGAQDRTEKTDFAGMCTAASVQPTGLCGPFQIQAARLKRPDGNMSDEQRANAAKKWCPCWGTPGHESTTSAAHQLPTAFDAALVSNFRRG